MAHPTELDHRSAHDARGPWLPDVIRVLDTMVGSAEPAVVFLSASRLCVPLLCRSITIALSEAGERTYTISNPRAPGTTGIRLPAGGAVGFGGVAVDVDSTVTEIHGRATDTHSAYEGVLVMDFLRPGLSHDYLAQLVVDRATALVDLERANEGVELQRERADHLELALRTNREIGIAMGILMTRHQVTEDKAFELLKGTSQHAHRKIRDIALDVIHTGELEAPQRRQP